MARPRALPLRTRVIVLVGVTALVPVGLLALVRAGGLPVPGGWALAGVLAVHLGFSAALAWGAARSVTAPLARLGLEAERIARGELAEPVADVGRDEVGRLGRALEAMRAGLAAHVRLVEQNARLVERDAARAARLREVIEAQEAERRRVARELHDDTSQSLAALALAVDRAQEALQEGRDPGLGEVRALALRTLDEVGRIVRDLRPAVLDDLGFASAVQAIADRELARRGVTVRCELAEGVDGRLPPEAATALFRMVQEAIGNAAKHARASQVLVEVEVRGADLVASVEDDGVGFEPRAVRPSTTARTSRPSEAGAGLRSGRTDQIEGRVDDRDTARPERSAATGPEAQAGRRVVEGRADGSGSPQRRGFGLIGLRERADLLGGSVRIDSSPGQGTRVEIRIPLEPGAPRVPVAGEGT